MIQITKLFIKLLFSICIIAMVSFSAYATTFDSYSYLRNISSDEFDKTLLSKEEIEYIEHLIFDPISKVFPLALQEKLLKSEYSSLDQIKKELHYSQIWEIEIRKLDMFSELPIDVFFAVRTDMTPNWLIAPILFDELSRGYYILGIEELSSTRFNETINVFLISKLDAIEYIKDCIKFTFDLRPIDEEWFDVSTYKYRRIKNYIHLLHPPKLLFFNNEIFIVELFVQTNSLSLRKGIKKMIAIVTKHGEITLLEMQTVK